MATVRNLKDTKTTNMTTQASRRFAKTKELQSQHTKAGTQLQHICFCPDTQRTSPLFHNHTLN